MLALMPMPVTFSKMLQGAAKEVSKKSDDRVETVTESAYSYIYSTSKTHKNPVLVSDERHQNDQDVRLGG